LSAYNHEQAAVARLENRHKASKVRAEQALEAAVEELRKEFASAQRAEARRLESLVDSSSTLIRHSSIIGIAKARATLASDLHSIRTEVWLWRCLAYPGFGVYMELLGAQSCCAAGSM
jgi:hypothetical protein